MPNPRTPEERQKNKENLALAVEIRSDKERDLKTKKHGKSSPVKQIINFLDYYQSYIDSYTKKDIRMMEGSLQRFKDFLSEYYPFMQATIKPEQIDKEMVTKFVEYLQSRSVGEGARGYFQRFKKVIKHALEQDIFQKNPCNGVVCVVDDGALTKDVLTLEEIQQLAKTPLSQTLLSLIGEKPGKDTYIFELPSHTGCLKTLRTWVARAGIDKHITWHCARHSFAVNLLGECQTDIKTVASFLGHSGLKHTEKYTRAVDSLKEKAVNSLSDIEF